MAQTSRPNTITVSRWKVVNDSRTSSGKLTQRNTTVARSTPPNAIAAIRTPRGRKVTGRLGAAVAPGSEAAGMDVGGDDAPGTDVEQLVHDPLGLVPRHHGAHRHPALAMQ